MTNTTGAPLQRLTAERGEVLQRSAAGWLAARGAAPGDRIAVDHDGSESYLAFVIAALRSGVVPVPLPDGMPEVDRDHLVADAEVWDRVGPEDWETIFGHARTGLGPIPLTRPMLYTSGTTGRRKGVWFGVWTADVARRAYLDEHDQWGFAPDGTHLVCSPLYHSAPLRFAMHTLLAGGDVLLQHRFNASAIAEAILTGEATTAFVVPAHLQRILDLQPPPPSPRRRWLAHAGSPCPDALRRRVLEWAPAEKIWEFYGSTEAQFTACRGDEWLENPGTVGRARRGRTLSVDQREVVWCTQPDFARFAVLACARKDRCRLERHSLHGW